MKQLVALVLVRLRPRPPRPGERPCDARCGRMVHPSRAHTHHHEPGCGLSPTPWSCSCNYFLCPDCCPCDVAGLVRKAG